MTGKLSRSTVVAVVVGRRYVTVGGGGTSGEDIHEQTLHFSRYRRHLRGSNRPAGVLRADYCGKSVDVRWLWTERHGYFAPELSFRPNTGNLKLAHRVAEMLVGEPTPEQLIERLACYEAERIDDRKDGCYDDYRVVRAPGDGPLAMIGRATVG